MLPVLFILLPLILGIKIICIGFISSVLVFVITAAVYRLKIDKNDFQVMYTGIQAIILILVSFVLSWLLNYKIIAILFEF